MESEALIDNKHKLWNNLRVILYIVGALLLFLFALDLMVSSLNHLGRGAAETILLATSNPFTGLFIGLLITAMLQSSSTTTALVVALVASRSITLESAIPIIMGANIGTTITSTIVSLGFIYKRKEFRRAVAAGTYHAFFNILTAIILFPLEYYYGFLSNLSSWIGLNFFSSLAHPVENRIQHSSTFFHGVIDFLQQNIPSPFFLVLLALVILFGSILIFRKLISDLLKAKSPVAFSRFFFKNQFKSFSWGLLTTAAIRSSTITTSVVVPIVAKKITTLKEAAPFIMGANIGTTVTAFIAAILNTNTSGAISIAIAHFLFNFIGVLLFFPIPVMRKMPIEIAHALGRLTLKYRLAGLVFLLLTFFFIPFSLIYMNQDAIQTLTLTYQRTDAVKTESYYRIISRTNTHSNSGEWLHFEGKEPSVNEEPSIIHPVYVKNNTLFVGSRMFLFNRPGFCWDGEDEKRRYKACIDQVLKKMNISNTTFDSVYVCTITYLEKTDSTIHRYYISAPYKIMLEHEVVSNKKTPLTSEKLVKFDRQ